MAAALEFKRRVRTLPDRPQQNQRGPGSPVYSLGIVGWLGAVLLGFGIQYGYLPVRQWVRGWEAQGLWEYSAPRRQDAEPGLEPVAEERLADPATFVAAPVLPPAPSTSSLNDLSVPQDPLPAPTVGAQEVEAVAPEPSVATASERRLGISSRSSGEANNKLRAGELAMRAKPSPTPEEFPSAPLFPWELQADDEKNQSPENARQEVAESDEVALRESAHAPPAEPSTASAPGALETAGSHTCEGAIKSYRDEIVIGGGRAAPDISRAQYAALLENGSWFRQCDVPSHVRLDVCVAVRYGRAVGVTIQTSPTHRAQERCVAAAARRLTFPSHSRLDVTNTTFTPE